MPELVVLTKYHKIWAKYWKLNKNFLTLTLADSSFAHIVILILQMNKKKLLEDMAEEESRNDSKLVELQKQRENERKILNSR